MMYNTTKNTRWSNVEEKHNGENNLNLKSRRNISKVNKGTSSIMNMTVFVLNTV